MTPNSPAHLLAAAQAAEHGAGPLLRIVLVVMLVGCALVGWLLLRGYRQEPEPERPAATGDSGGTPPPDPGPAGTDGGTGDVAGTSESGTVEGPDDAPASGAEDGAQDAAEAPAGSGHAAVGSTRPARES